MSGRGVYTYVGNDPLDRTDPTGLAGCGGSLSKDQCTQAMSAQSAALDAVKSARESLQGLKSERAEIAAGSRSELSAGASATEEKLGTYFKDSSAKTISKVDGVLAGTQKILEDNGSKYNFQSSSASRIGSAIAGPDAVAFAHPFLGKNIYLAPQFSKESANFQAQVAIHEPAHLQWINAFPPQGETYGDAAVRALTMSQALNNADSYTQFVSH